VTYQKSHEIYLDYAATSPMDPKVLSAMTEVLAQEFGNPSSVTHAFGWRAKAKIDEARASVAECLQAKPEEIIFTSGATESNNLAILGVAHACKARSQSIVTLKTEHKATLAAVDHLRQEGYSVRLLGVDAAGRVKMDEFEAALKTSPSLVSVMMVNNETGVVQDLPVLLEKAKAAGAFFHVDAAQAMGKIPVDLSALPIDLLSISAHKVYGPKGVGALYLRSRPKVPLRPLLFGGSQERSLRPGTLATHQIVGLAKALELASTSLAQDLAHVNLLSQELLGRLALLPKIQVNGFAAKRVPHILNVRFSGVDAEALLASLPQLAVSMGSACTSGTTEASHVLSAMGLSDEEANASLRFSFGRFTALADIRTAADAVVEAVAQLRALSPIWELA